MTTNLNRCPLDTDGDGDCPACARDPRLRRPDCKNGIIVDPLADLVTELAEAYHNLKEAERRMKGDKSKKNPQTGLRDRFFDEATKASMAALATKTTLILEADAIDSESAWTEAERRYPGWTVVAVAHDEERKVWRIIIKEDPNLKPFEYVDKKNKLVWSRQVSNTQADLDEETLRARDPKLWKRITKPTRKLRDLHELTPEDLAAIQRYVYPGHLQAKLAAPRKAKPEELDD